MGLSDAEGGRDEGILQTSQSHKPDTVRRSADCVSLHHGTCTKLTVIDADVTGYFGLRQRTRDRLQPNF